MKTLLTLKISILNWKKTLFLCPLLFLIAVIGEGLQHVVEWKLGMYHSIDMFRAHQGDTIRIGFGVIKGVCLFVGVYFIAKKLAATYGPPPRFGSFNKDFIRKSWDLSFGVHGLIAVILCSIPLIILHYRISYLAMGHNWAPFFLVIDSLVVGLIALAMATTMWAADVVNAET